MLRSSVESEYMSSKGTTGDTHWGLTPIVTSSFELWRPDHDIAAMVTVTAANSKAALEARDYLW